MAMLWTGLAAASWVLGKDLPFSIGLTALAVAYFWLSWHARRPANDPFVQAGAQSAGGVLADPTNGGTNPGLSRRVTLGRPEQSERCL